MRATDIQRIHYGYIVVPEDYPDAGQPLVVTGFVVPHPEGLVLFDTGLTPITDEVRERYHPRRRPAREALAQSGVDPDSISAIVNCHQHLDHSGGNWEFPGVPVYVQRVELGNARGPDFTYPEYTCDYPGAVLEVIDGEHQLRPGLQIVPSPGHTSGHQSLLVDTDDGVVMLAGQAAEGWNFGGALLSERLERELGDRIGTYPDWARFVHERKVERALLSHELMIWERDRSEIGRPIQG